MGKQRQLTPAEITEMCRLKTPKKEQPGKEGEQVWPLNGYAPGSYMNTCTYCKKSMQGVDKLCFVCLECSVKAAHEYIAELERRLLKYQEADERKEKLRRGQM